MIQRDIQILTRTLVILFLAATSSQLVWIINPVAAGPSPPPTTSTYHTDPTPVILSSNVTEAFLHKELTGYPSYGYDGAADILYTGQAATWNFPVPSSVNPSSIIAANFTASLILDDHYSVNSSFYRLATWINGNFVSEGVSNLPHGSPFGSIFTNWVQRPYVVPVAEPLTLFTITLQNNSTLTSTADWIGVDWIDLQLFLSGQIAPFVGRICLVPGDTTACPQTIPHMLTDSGGHLDVSVNILGSPSFNATGMSLHWDPTLANETGLFFNNTILPSPTVRADCVNNSGVGCGPQDGPGVAHLDLVGGSTAAPTSGRLLKLSLAGAPGVDPHVGFATGCSTVSVGGLNSTGSVPNTNLCVVVGVITTAICTSVCIETLAPDPEEVQSQSLGAHLPTGLSTGIPSGNITGTLSSGAGPNFADTFILPFQVTLPGNITAWKAQFSNGIISPTIPFPPTPVGVQIKVFRRSSVNNFTVVEVGPVHDPRPVLALRLPTWPFNVTTQETVIPYYTDTLLTVQPGDFIGLTLMSNSTFGIYEYPEISVSDGTRFVTSNVTLGESIDLSNIFTGTLPGFAPTIDITIQPSPARLDTTGDGIPDFVALSPEMQALGVDPCRKTVLVQLDYMVPSQGTIAFKPLQQALDDVTAAFDAAPVPAVLSCPYQGFPRKPTGIKLVLDVENAVPEQDAFSFTHSEPLSFDMVKAANFDPNRVHYFHYGIFINQTAPGDTTSGVGETFGSNFLVSLGNWTDKVGSVFEQAGTLMHELGHNLGLHHGGVDAVNFKPNYLSVMSYEHQVVGITSRTPTGDVTRFDFSREAMPTLNESSLNEFTMISNSSDYTKWVCPDHHTVQRDVVSNRLDWNCDGHLSTSVANDLNNDTVTGVLTGFNDWTHLQFKFTQSDNFNIGCRVNCDIGCRVNCDIGCRVNCDIGCRVGCDIGCRVGCDFGTELDRKTAVAIEASWAVFLASPHRSTSTSLTCNPSSVIVNNPTRCTATVSDINTGSPITPTGTVSFLNNQPGNFAPATCSLSGTGATATCSVNYDPSVGGPQQITAAYTHDTNHLGSNGAFSLNGLPQPIQKLFTLINPNLPPSQSFVPLNTVLTWSVTYLALDPFSTPMTSTVLSDRFAANLAVDTSTITYSAPPGSGASTPIFSTKTGTQPQWFFTWNIGTLKPGQTATLTVQVHSAPNPKGVQGYTGPGLQILNSGATLKWTPPSSPMQSFATLPNTVMAGNTLGAVDGVVTSGGSGISGATVTLSIGGRVVGIAKTGERGFYHFDTLTPGVYTVSVATSTGTATATAVVTGGAVTQENLLT